MGVTNHAEPEDRRQAASLIVSTSSSIASGALAIAAAVVAITTYVSDKYEPRWWFYALILVAGILLGIGFLLGSKGTAEIAKGGYDGKWQRETKGKLFNRQSQLTVAAGAVLIAAVIVGVSSERREDTSARGTATALAAADQRLDTLANATLSLRRRARREASRGRALLEDAARLRRQVRALASR
jgi:mannose/fructose/N-acetylgalactosamine-specific phosphotransferase system component IIC